MKPLSRRPATLLFVALSGLVFLFSSGSGDARRPDKAPKGPAKVEAPTLDLAAFESPKKPAPTWLEIVDQGKFDPRLKGYKTPSGIKVEIVAEEPVVVNPVGMTFADDGTPFVLEWRPSPGDEWREKAETFTYKDGTTRQVATMSKRLRDLLKLLILGKGGSYDGFRPVLDDELPSSVLLHDGWIYLSGRGTVRRFKQSRPGGPYDTKQVIAQGFCGFHHHQVSGMTLGNDGWLYITSGDDDNYAEGSDGSRATVLRTGAVFRCRPDGSKLHTYAMGFRNPYRDVAFDSAYNMFHVDNDNEDGSKFQGCRLMHVPEGSDFGWRLYQGARCCKPDLVRGAAIGELPGKVPPLLKTGRGSPAGLLIYNDTRFPTHYRGLLIYPDVFRKLIRAYKVEQQGAGFVVTEEFELMKSDDPLFRPCQAVLGPDGAIYVVDWRTNSGGAGKLWGDGKHGRIYRLSWAGTADDAALPLRPMNSWARFAKMKDSELIEALSAEDFSDRERARNELVKHGDRNRPALLKLLANEDANEGARIAALGALQSMWNDDVRKAFIARLGDDGDLARLAADGLGLNCERGDRATNASLLAALATEDRAVRRAVAMAMGRIGAPGAGDSLAATLTFDNGKDVYLRDGVVRAIEMLGKPGIDSLLALADDGVQKHIDLVATTFTALRSRPAYEALPTLLKGPHFNDAQRAALIASASNYLFDPPVSLEPIADYLIASPSAGTAVKLAGLEMLGVPGGRVGPKGSAWVLAQLDDKEQPVRRAATEAIGKIGVSGAGPRLAKMLTAPRLSTAERLVVLRALRPFREKSAVPVLKALAENAGETTPEGQQLRREAFLTLAAMDPTAASTSARAFLEKGDRILQAQAVTVLGTSADGARFAAKLFLDKKLPRELLPEVSEALRRHSETDEAVAKQLGEVMRSGLLVKYTPAEVTRLRRLVATKGDAMRGRALYLNGKTLACITCHRLEGIGGSVGPDLTGVSATTSFDKVLEAVLEPSKEIKEGYQTYQATTKRGLVYQGLRISQTEKAVVLRAPDGKDVRIPAKDIEELKALKTSLMPDNVVSLLSYNEFIDLIAFLTNKGAQESLRGLALDFWVVGPFGPDLKTAYPPETKADPSMVYPGDKRWETAQAKPNGLLDLKGIFKDKAGSAYALTYVHSPRAQKAEMRLGSNDPVRVWVNGTQAHQSEKKRSAKPDEDRVSVALNEGWNAVLVKLAGGPGEHGLYLRFVGAGLRVARTPEGK